MFKNNRNLLIIALVVLVNSLGYGIIIPILDAYTQRFGMSNFQYALLFSVFSICQFIATPIIGRMSDKYGRKPLLTVSIAGTALSFFMMAFAPNTLFLFLARALDGITAGNIPVAYAVISDTTAMKDRAKGFGIIGASFGFGFVFGPAIAALTAQYGVAMPFIIAGVITLVAVVLTALYLPETNKHIGEVRKGKLFDFKKMYEALRDENVGTTFIISFTYFLAFGMLITSFQPFAREVLRMTPTDVASLFTLFGVVGLVTQILLVSRITKRFGLKPSFSASLLLMALSFLGLFFAKTVFIYAFFSVLFGVANSLVNPLILTILSQETDEKSQGSMQGLNSAFTAMGNIVGPIVAGIIVTYLTTSSPFLAASVLCVICFILSFHVLRKGAKKESAF